MLVYVYKYHTHTILIWLRKKMLWQNDVGKEKNGEISNNFSLRNTSQKQHSRKKERLTFQNDGSNYNNIIYYIR